MHTTRQLSAFAVATLIVFLLAIVPRLDTASAASPKACTVRNATLKATYRSLSAAIGSAKRGNLLTVRGVCKGKATVTQKRLTIKGVWTKRSGRPTLRGNGRGPVLHIRGGDPPARIEIKNLLIEGRPTERLRYTGAGLRISGSMVTLRNVTVRSFKTTESGGRILLSSRSKLVLRGNSSIKGNTASSGGGILNDASTVRLEDTSSVRGNSADQGAGVSNESDFARLVLTDSSRIAGNRAQWYGGGLSNQGEAWMGVRSSVSGNKATRGAGIFNDGRLQLSNQSTVEGNLASERGGGTENTYNGKLTMSGSSAIRDNTAAVDGGGLRNKGSLAGVVCWPDAGYNVYDNSPDDCGVSS